MASIYKIKFSAEKLSKGQYDYLLSLSENFRSNNNVDDLGEVIFEFPKCNYEDLLKTSIKPGRCLHKDFNIHSVRFQS